MSFKKTLLSLLLKFPLISVLIYGIFTLGVTNVWILFFTVAVISLLYNIGLKIETDEEYDAVFPVED